MLDWAYMGRMAYPEALALQHALRDRALEGAVGPVLLLMEHSPVVTVGRRGALEDLRVSAEELRARGVDLVHIDRGGLLTYHGPGQLVGYPIVNLERLGLGVHDYVKRLSDGLADMLALHDLDANWSEERPGLWVGPAKIASFGVHVQHSVTTHGFALNVQLELAAFEMIVACGHEGSEVTSMAALRGELWSLEHLAAELAPRLAARLGLEARARGAAEILAMIRRA